MNSKLTDHDIDTISVPERVELIERLWASLPEDAEVPLAPGQREELERRLAITDATGPVGSSPQDVATRLLARIG